MKVKEEFINKFNREPTFAEITKEMKESSKNVFMALESIIEPVSLNEPLYSDSTDTV